MQDDRQAMFDVACQCISMDDRRRLSMAGQRAKLDDDWI